MQYEQANQPLATPPFLPNPILDALASDGCPSVS